MEVKVFGLGYVGTVTALSLCQLGHQVEGIESVAEKVKSLREGKLHLFEEGLDEQLNKVCESGTFIPRQKPTSFKEKRNVICICVGTPMNADGSVNLEQVRGVFSEIEELLRGQPEDETLVLLRSTIPPGTSRSLFKEFLSHFPKERLDFVFYPEFLREGQAIEDFNKPRLFCLGGESDCEKKWIDFFQLLPGFSQNLWVSFESAELIKYAQNSYNALRITFANELGTIASSYGVSHEELYKLMSGHNENEKPGTYLKPGFSYGGPCLSKEVEALAWLGRKSTHEFPLINEIANSNERHFERFLTSIEKLEAKNILFCGVTFKENTDDLRHSFVLSLIERLINKPSYLVPAKLTILDRPMVISRLKSAPIAEKEFIRMISLDELTLGDYDLIIKGPFSLPNGNLEELKRLKVNVIDLGFHKETTDFPF